jgi:hypothetical protein
MVKKVTVVTVILFLLLLMTTAVVGAAAITKTLSKDTKLHPQGWLNGFVILSPGPK